MALVRLGLSGFLRPAGILQAGAAALVATASVAVQATVVHHGATAPQSVASVLADAAVTRFASSAPQAVTSVAVDATAVRYGASSPESVASIAVIATLGIKTIAGPFPVEVDFAFAPIVEIGRVAAVEAQVSRTIAIIAES